MIVNRILFLASRYALLSMCLFSLLVVILRYVFGIGLVWLQELVLYLHAVVFLFSSAWTLRKNKHVRVDVLHSNFTKETKSKIDLLGDLIFAAPMLLVITWASYPYIFESWRWFEKSSDAGGLPLVFIMKTFIIVFALSLLLELGLRSVKFFRGKV